MIPAAGGRTLADRRHIVSVRLREDPNSMTRTIANPVGTLRDHATAMEAAITVCLGDPTAAAVHELRRESRRIEAQIDLLAHVEGIPPFAKAAAKLLKQLKRVRRAAGTIRDLDVQRQLIATLAGQLKAAPAGMSAHEIKRLQEQAGQLRKDLKRDRKRAEQEPIEVLTARQAKTAAAMERLLEALQPVAGLGLSSDQLQREVAEGFRRRCARATRQKHSDERLHGIRKAAKVARYQAEIAPGSREARRTAKVYGELQEAGGKWHDWLQLAVFADSTLGAHQEFAEQITARRNHEHDSFRELLDRNTAPAKRKSWPRHRTKLS
jgi:CHAD domain-containing protein